MNCTESIRKRFKDLIFKTDIPSRHDAEELYSTLSKGDIPGTYFWRDIDYSVAFPSDWPASLHPLRILTILRGYGEKKLSDKEFLEKIVGALKYWSEKDFINSNWWYNEIGIPQKFGYIGILLYDVADEETKAFLEKMCGRGSKTNLPGPLSPPDWSGRWTGANLIWTAKITAIYALLKNDADCLRLASDLASGEIAVGAAEGIQKDGSFFQHGPLLYSGGYGRSFAYDIATLSYIFDGTPYQFTREKLDIFLTHILDGVRKMTVRGYLDWQCTGREYVRPGKVAAWTLKNAVRLMTKTADMPRAEEISAYYKELCGEASPDGTKYFDVARFLSHRFGGIYVGARFTANHLRSAEICNSENCLGKNLSYGTSTCIMKRGDEYYDIAPVWNYSRIPGTTSRTETDEELKNTPEWDLPKNDRDESVRDILLSDGGQNKGRAVIFEHCLHDGVEALCADFAFEGGYLRLGTGIRDTTGKNEALVTTIDQRKIFGEMFEADFAFYIDGICYMSLDGKDIVDREEKVVGSWTRNNPFHPDSSEVTEELLTLEIHHKAGEESSYAYLICEEDNEPEVEVLRNDRKAQGIRLPDGGIMAVIYEKTALEDGGKVYDCGIVIEEAKK